jgi:hypothetical protein
MAGAKGKRVKCEDCYFRQQGLCTLDQSAPCAIWRSAEKGLAPERQLAFAFRTDRMRSAYVFPQPG